MGLWFPGAGTEETLEYFTVRNGDKTPPSVTKNFVAVDDGNCSPRYLRATTYHMPLSRELAAQAKLPLAIICKPFGLPGDNEVTNPTVHRCLLFLV
jgi:hypothetical protein